MAKLTTGSGCLILFSLPFAAVGVVMLFFIGSHVWQSHTFSQWPTVPASILEAELKTHSSSDGTTYQVKARYAYEWEGVSYEGSRVGIGKTSDNIGSFHQRKARTLKHAQRHDKRINVHVNPDAPDDAILYPDIRWELMAFQGVFALVFGGAGFGMLIGGLIHRKNEQKRQTLITTHPGEPWTWKPEWVAGEIRSGGKTGAIAMTLFTVFWNLVSLPVLFAFPEEFLEKGNKAMLIALIFPVVGVLMIAGTVYLWMRFRKYGACTFVLQHVPGVIGGRLSGAIRIPNGLQAPDGVELSLRNVRKITTGSGKHRTTREQELWSASRPLSSWRNSPTGEALLPVTFDIPFDCTPFDDTDPDNKVAWELKARAKTPGVNFEAAFDVPVFQTPDSDPDFVVQDAPSDDWKQPHVLENLWQEENIRVEQGPLGATRLVFPMVRHKGYCFGLLFITLIWNSITVGIVLAKAPLLFPIIFGLLGLLLLEGTISSCLTRHVLDLRSGQLEARGGLFGLSGPHTFGKEALATLTHKTSSSQGNTQYYVLYLYLVRENGRKHRLVSLVKGEANAERLLHYIRTQCGIDPDD